MCEPFRRRAHRRFSRPDTGLSAVPRSRQSGWTTHAVIGMLANMSDPGRDSRSGRLRTHEACTHCGYDLIGASLSDKCPECGTPVAASAGESLAAAAAEAEVIPSGRSCVHCGYALGGMPMVALCPECGKPATDSAGDVVLERSALERAFQSNRSCVHCGYNLRGQSLDGVCPECGRPKAESAKDILLAASRRSGTVENTCSCIYCGYNLLGLRTEGVCPECGKGVAESLRGLLLAYAAPEYRRSVKLGLNLILWGIMLMVVLTLASIPLALLAGTGGRLVAQALSALNSGLMIYGYWRYTEPDLGYTGLEAPHSARQVARIAISIHAAAKVADLVLLAAANVRSSIGGLGGNPLEFFGFLVYLTGMIAWGVQFFAILRHTRWIAGRVPDQFIVKQCRSYIWGLPVLSTFGLVLVGLGPLIAMVLYWNLMDRLRKHIRSIERTGAPAMLGKARG